MRIATLKLIDLVFLPSIHGFSILEQEAIETPSVEGKPSLTAKSQEFPAPNLQLCCQQTSCSNTEVTDQNFVEDDYALQKVNTLCNKKRKITSAVYGSGNNQIIKTSYKIKMTRLEWLSGSKVS